MKTWIKRLGFWGFMFFLVKGLLWLAIPALVALFATNWAGGFQELGEQSRSEGESTVRSDQAVPFTPGFSQVNPAGLSTRNRFKRFLCLVLRSCQNREP